MFNTKELAEIERMFAQFRNDLETLTRRVDAMEAPKHTAVRPVERQTPSPFKRKGR